MALTDTERERVKLHLGYLNTNLGASISLGFPAASQSQFLVENAMTLLKPEGEPGVRRAVAELDCIQDQLSVARGRLAVSQAGDVHLRGPEEFAELETQYGWWSAELADILGVHVNPFSNKHNKILGQITVIDPA
jgi:hypothetical protein